MLTRGLLPIQFFFCIFRLVLIIINIGDGVSMLCIFDGEHAWSPSPQAAVMTAELILDLHLLAMSHDLVEVYGEEIGRRLFIRYCRQTVTQTASTDTSTAYAVILHGLWGL